MSASTAPARLGEGEHLWDLWRIPRVVPGSAFRMWQRDWTLYKRSWRMNVLPNFFEPLLYLLAIGFGLGLYVGRQIEGVEYIRFIAPGLVAAAAMNGSVFEVTFNVFVKMRFAKLYDAVITTPLEPEDVAAGEIAWAVTRSFIYGGAFLLITALLGYVSSPLALLGPLAVILIGLSFAFVGIIFTSLIPLIDQFSYFFTLFITPLFLFSGIFFPIADLPGVARPIAWLTPLHHGVELMRSLALTGDAATAGAHALWLLAFCALLAPPAINLLRRRLVT
jgi:lipooligosaccharide transport system permease protein